MNDKTEQSLADELRAMATSNSDLYEYERLQLKDAAGTIDTLRADLDRAIVNFGDAAATVCDMRAQLAEAQRDSERYHFLAGFGVPVHSPRWAHWRIERWTKDGWEPIHGNLMNAAIDAAKETL